ncbi:hypothetical protein P7K49_008906 [Saguinus oedipus]|uniref:Uncharacterized protein n=1 Tax=Saguinus oedipus TaxID=9490 RepID=A0ABQ9VZM8_SAGOE|nr:hypothetical protein P7K49_008906 [Saguinus oedipus]
MPCTVELLPPTSAEVFQGLAEPRYLLSKKGRGRQVCTALTPRHGVVALALEPLMGPESRTKEQRRITPKLHCASAAKSQPAWAVPWTIQLTEPINEQKFTKRLQRAKQKNLNSLQPVLGITQHGHAGGHSNKGQSALTDRALLLLTVMRVILKNSVLPLPPEEDLLVGLTALETMWNLFNTGSSRDGAESVLSAWEASILWVQADT